MLYKLCFWASMLIMLSCTNDQNNSLKVKAIFTDSEELMDRANIPKEEQQSIETIENIGSPDAYVRKLLYKRSFSYFLRNLPLKPNGSLVHYYNGSTKANNDVYHSVIDLPIGNKDLHQCADAIIRLKAEYHWKNEEYNKIHFNFTNGFKVEYLEWLRGSKMVVDGNKTYWEKGNARENTYSVFWDYLELIFMYAGTASLEKELIKIDKKEADIGDVLMKGGHPGHAVIIVDKVVHSETGNPLYLLAQSYMPAQELQILNNPEDAAISPWYNLSKGDIETPEWTFSSDQIMRFSD